METIILSNVQGFARLSGTDEHGNAWVQFCVDYYDVDTMPAVCAICGKEIATGWQCLDGGEEVCSSHIRYAYLMR